VSKILHDSEHNKGKNDMELRTLGGRNGARASAIGLGCMGMSDIYGPADRNLSIKTDGNAEWMRA